MIERKEAGQTPYLEAQVDIKKKIKEDGIKQQIQEYLEKLRAQTPVLIISEKSGTLEPWTPPKK